MLASLIPQPAPPAPSPGTPALAQDTFVWLGGYDLSRAVDSVALAAARAELPTTKLDDTLVGAYPGRMSVDAMLHGFWSAGAGEPDTIVAPRIMGPSPDVSEWPLTFLPPVNGTAGADGACEYTLRAASLGIRFGGQHGELLPFSLASRARAGTLDRGTVILPKATRTATATGTAYALGGVTSVALRMVVSLHVFSVTGGGGSVTVRVESDTVGFGSPVTRATFDAVATAAGVGRQTLEITDISLDNWWRVVATWTPGTNYSLAVVAALVAR